MPSPVAHSLAGYLLYRLTVRQDETDRWPPLWAYIAMPISRISISCSGSCKTRRFSITTKASPIASGSPSALLCSPGAAPIRSRRACDGATAGCSPPFMALTYYWISSGSVAPCRYSGRYIPRRMSTRSALCPDLSKAVRRMLGFWPA